MLDFSLLSALYLGSADTAIHDIRERYIKNGSCVINFLYFTNLADKRLVEGTPQLAQKNYLAALKGGDFLFADGIAIQLFYRWFAPRMGGNMPENLNGTDLNPLLIDALMKETTVSLYLYQCYDPPKGKTIAFLQKGSEALQKRFPGLSLPRAEQCLFREKGKNFDWQSFQDTANKDTAQIKIFFNCTGSPFQEIWSFEHKIILSKLGFLVINAGGTIDYLTGFEKRAPRWVVKARILETFRRILVKPKKNLTKFLKMFGFFRILSKKLLHLIRR